MLTYKQALKLMEDSDGCTLGKINYGSCNGSQYYLRLINVFPAMSYLIRKGTYNRLMNYKLKTN